MKQVLVALDQLFNTLLFWLPGGCWADETLSARSWRCRKFAPFNVLRPAIDLLFFWQLQHCFLAYQSERLRMQSPPEERHG